MRMISHNPMPPTHWHTTLHITIFTEVIQLPLSPESQGLGSQAGPWEWTQAGPWEQTLAGPLEWTSAGPQGPGPRARQSQAGPQVSPGALSGAVAPARARSRIRSSSAPPASHPARAGCAWSWPRTWSLPASTPTARVGDPNCKRNVIHLIFYLPIHLFNF